MNVTQAVDWRYAAKKLLPDKMVPEEKVRRIMDAVRKAPSARNMQPWKFIVIRDKALQAELDSQSLHQEKASHASHLVIVCALRTFRPEYADRLAALTAEKRGQTAEDVEEYRQKMITKTEALSPERFFAWSKQMCFIALGFLFMAAALEEVDAGPIGGFKKEPLEKLLGLENSDYTPVFAVALGYRDPSDKYAHLAKVRFDESDVIEWRS